jgi:uncharacterized protein (DUF488 family)
VAVALGIVSIGHEGRSAADLVAALTGADVVLVVDVRLNPMSRRPGLGRRQLPAALSAAGVGYRHEPALGNPVENRAGFHHPGRDGRAWEEAVRRYPSRLDEPEAAAARRRILETARACAPSAVALLCVEADEARCHRHQLIERLQQDEPDLEIVSL